MVTKSKFKTPPSLAVTHTEPRLGYTSAAEDTAKPNTSKSEPNNNINININNNDNYYSPPPPPKPRWWWFMAAEEQINPTDPQNTYQTTNIYTPHRYQTSRTQNPHRVTS